MIESSFAPSRRPSRPRQRHQAHQSRAAGRRRAWRLHLGRARSSARRRTADGRRHFRHLGRRGQRGDAGRRPGARRPARKRASGWPISGARRASAAICPTVQRAVADRLFSLLPSEGSPTFNWFKAWSQYLSPYDLNPLNINPLKDLIERFVDFDAVRADARQIFIAATNVQTGRLHIFPHDKISAEVGDGLGLPAGGVPRGRDRRRALLGRRLSRQSGALSVLPLDRRPRTC